MRRIYFLAPNIEVSSEVPSDRVEEIEGIIKKHHPDAECGGTEPEIPAFP
jgi:hypothetical protein